jgi:uncharacterized membrane protein YeaQ/YmgE (transglycosylase-associated protein family)
MSLVTWIVIGLVVGLAQALAPGRSGGRRGCGATFLSGLAAVAGALLGGWLSTLLGFGGIAGGLDARNLTVAGLGAVVTLVAWRLLAGRRT